jgi:hypothetical protein
MAPPLETDATSGNKYQVPVSETTVSHGNAAPKRSHPCPSPVTQPSVSRLLVMSSRLCLGPIGTIYPQNLHNLKITCFDSQSFLITKLLNYSLSFPISYLQFSLSTIKAILYFQNRTRFVILLWSNLLLLCHFLKTISSSQS